MDEKLDREAETGKNKGTDGEKQKETDDLPIEKVKMEKGQQRANKILFYPPPLWDFPKNHQKEKQILFSYLAPWKRIYFSTI